MSGGSYNYLCHVWDLSDLLAKRGDLQSMAARLTDLDEREFPGATAAATMTRRLDLLLQMWDVHGTAQLGLLRDAWKAVEWWDSCDWGPDQVREALAELVTPPAPPEPEYCCEHDDDAHDGAGCLDCSCNLGPMHTKAGYNPTPASVIKARADEAARLRP